jgi:hypothetical protein
MSARGGHLKYGDRLVSITVAKTRAGSAFNSPRHSGRSLRAGSRPAMKSAGARYDAIVW